MLDMVPTALCIIFKLWNPDSRNEELFIQATRADGNIHSYDPEHFFYKLVQIKIRQIASRTIGSAMMELHYVTLSECSRSFVFWDLNVTIGSNIII